MAKVIPRHKLSIPITMEAFFIHHQSCEDVGSDFGIHSPVFAFMPRHVVQKDSRKLCLSPLNTVLRKGKGLKVEQNGKEFW